MKNGIVRNSKKNYLIVRCSKISDLVESVSTRRERGWTTAGGVIVEVDEFNKTHYLQAVICAVV